jgi:hypothetical protein
MKIYRKVLRSYVTCDSVEVSDEQAELYEIGEISLEDLFDNKEDEMCEVNKFPEMEYEEREYAGETIYDLSFT